MPNICNTQLLVDGTQKATVLFYLESDGNEGEFVDRVVFNPLTDFEVPYADRAYADGSGLKPKYMTIMQAWYSMSWFDVTIGFNGTPPLRLITLARDTHPYQDFRHFRGVKDPNAIISSNPEQINQFTFPTSYPRFESSGGGLSGTGELTFTTTDFAPLNCRGHVILELRKD